MKSCTTFVSQNDKDMKQYSNINELTKDYAAQNISEGVKNDMESEVEFVKSALLVAKSRLDAGRKYGIYHKMHVIDGFGYVVIN